MYNVLKQVWKNKWNFKIQTSIILLESEIDQTELINETKLCALLTAGLTIKWHTCLEMEFSEALPDIDRVSYHQLPRPRLRTAEMYKAGKGYRSMFISHL